MNSTYIIAAIGGLGVIGGLSAALWPKKIRSSTTNSFAVAGGLAMSQDALKNQKWRPDVILSAIQDGVMMVGQDNLIHMVNPAAATITGWMPKDAIGLDFHNVLVLVTEKGEPYPEGANPISKALADSQTERGDNIALTARGDKRIPLSIVASPVTGDGATDGVVVVFRDISREKEEEKRRSDFVSTASHEMRTPLAAIEGYISLALNPKTAQIDQNARNYLEKATASTTHLGELFRDLLTSSKAEDGRLSSYPAVVEVGEMVQQAAEAGEFKAKEKNLTLQYNVSSDKDAGGKVIRPLYYAYVDPNRIREVLQNLIDNAIKYTMSGGITVRLTGNVSTVQIQVQDSGGGIPPEDIPHLFQKFYRVDSSATRTVSGTGLGLFICRKIIELYNGRIWVESQLGQGSTFYINLPRLTAVQALEMQKKQASVISPLDS
ncbi:MAG TPA: ATP-binding protein [Candidatus Saccharimonadales bacterium]|nr:ATP-binding protein [Candidatus Saccharimonadales bacterium]